MKHLAPLAAAAALLAAACSGMSDTQQRTLSGAGIGAAGGTVIGAIAGNAGLGAAVGAAAGATGGYIWDRHKQSEQAAFDRGVAEGQASRPN